MDNQWIWALLVKDQSSTPELQQKISEALSRELEEQGLEDISCVVRNLDDNDLAVVCSNDRTIAEMVKKPRLWSRVGREPPASLTTPRGQAVTVNIPYSPSIMGRALEEFTLQE